VIENEFQCSATVGPLVIVIENVILQLSNSEEAQSLISNWLFWCGISGILFLAVACLIFYQCCVDRDDDFVHTEPTYFKNYEGLSYPYFVRILQSTSKSSSRSSELDRYPFPADPESSRCDEEQIVGSYPPRKTSFGSVQDLEGVFENDDTETTPPLPQQVHEHFSPYPPKKTSPRYKVSFSRGESYSRRIEDDSLDGSARKKKESYTTHITDSSLHYTEKHAWYERARRINISDSVPGVWV